MSNNEHPVDLTANNMLPSVRDIVNRLEPGTHYLIESNASGDIVYDSDHPDNSSVHDLDCVYQIKVKPISKQVAPHVSQIESVIVLVRADFKFD